jgi:hypothetical protein
MHRLRTNQVKSCKIDLDCADLDSACTFFIYIASPFVGLSSQLPDCGSMAGASDCCDLEHF